MVNNVPLYAYNHRYWVVSKVNDEYWFYSAYDDLDKAVQVAKQEDKLVKENILRVGHTNRGFDIIEFTDKYGNNCSLQKSSIATEDCIWFGVQEEKLTCRNPEDIGWVDLDKDHIKFKLGYDSVLFHGRMHLTQEQVKELLPYLQRFVETGEII